MADFSVYVTGSAPAAARWITGSPLRRWKWTSNWPPATIQRITLEHSGTVSKACYYHQGDSGQPELFAAQAIGGANRCVAASGHVATVLVPPECSDTGVMPLCDRTSHHVPQPAKACFDLFSSSCEICCPVQPPDCTNQPDGYPGYTCTSLDNSFCSCACYQGKWSCAC